MRVLQIIADGNPGGGTVHVLQILSGLGKKYVFGLITQKGSYLSKEACRLGIPVYELDFFRNRLNPWTLLQLRRHVREFQPRLVHAHGGRAGLYFALGLNRIPTIYTVHGYHFSHKYHVMRWLALTAERAIHRLVDYVVFVSQYDEGLARKYRLLPAGKQRVVIWNSVSNNSIRKSEDAPFAKHIGFIGRLERQKDPFLFLAVCERLPGYGAMIIGGGSLENQVRAAIHQRGLSGVKMLGSLSHHETLQLLPSLGAVVMTSRWEGLPLVPLEAMQLGVPVVAINVGGLGEIIENEKTGLLIEGRSPDALAMAVRRVIEEADLRKLIVENARHRIASQFSEEKMLWEIQKVYGQFDTA
jgi:glycosyltransferase involved in cell wall biosynthesis